MYLDEVKILLLAHEIRLYKFRKSYTPNLVSHNFAQVFSSHVVSNEIHSTNVDSSSSELHAPHVEQDFSHFHGSRGSRRGRFDRGGGRNSNSHILCQFYPKHEHSNLTCWYCLITINSLMHQLVIPTILNNGSPYIMAMVAFLLMFGEGIPYSEEMILTSLIHKVPWLLIPYLPPLHHGSLILVLPSMS